MSPNRRYLPCTRLICKGYVWNVPTRYGQQYKSICWILKFPLTKSSDRNYPSLYAKPGLSISMCIMLCIYNYPKQMIQIYKLYDNVIIYIYNHLYLHLYNYIIIYIITYKYITLRSLNIDPETCFSNFKHSTSEGVQGLSYHGKQ